MHLSNDFLGLIAIDMFCDHYVFVNPSLTSTQIETCTSFNRNIVEQPWYIVLMTTLPTMVGILIILKNFTRSIYDMISAPLIIAMLGIFIFRINAYRDSLFNTTANDTKIREGFLQQLAYSHAIVGGLLIVLIILQGLAENMTKTEASSSPIKKNN